MRSPYDSASPRSSSRLPLAPGRISSVTQPSKSTQPQRPTGTGTRPPGGEPRPGDVEKALALRDVMDHAVKTHKEIAATRPRYGPSARPKVLAAVCVLLAAFSAYSWFARPEFIWGPTPKVAPARAETDARVAIFLLSRRIESYRKSHGALPATLAGMERAGSGISYRALADTVFELSANAGGKALVFRSDVPPGDFLGSARRVITGVTR